MSQVLRPVEGDRAGSALRLAPETALATPSHPRLRLSFVDLDGFGALSHLRLDGLDRPLTVLLGPNEAGKSTLFDFITAVLFGFPSRRADEHYRPPVDGGAHGGRIGLCDAAGEEWVIERHASPRKRLSVARPDGSTGDEEDLRRLLGNANVEVFRAVFSVDLDDLRRLDGMSSDEVREILFSSSILGQRRSATRALRELEARKELLVKPRQGGTANTLMAELRETKTRLRDARQEAGAFAAIRDEADRLEAELSERRHTIHLSQRRLRDLEALLACREIAGRREDAAVRLANIAPLGDEERRLLVAESRIDRLAAEVSGHLERVARARELHSQKAALEHSLSRVRALPARWADGVVRAEEFDADALQARLAPSLDHLARAEVALTAARAALRGAMREEDELRAHKKESCAASELPSAEEIAQHLVSLRELRAWQLRLEQLQHEERYESHRQLQPPRRPRQLVAVSMALAAVVLAAVAAWTMATGRLDAGAIVLFAVALVVAGVSLVAVRVLGPASGEAREQEQSAVSKELEEASRAANRLRVALGLRDDAASSVVIQRLVDESELAAERRRALDAELRERAAAGQRVAAARRSEEEALAQRDCLTEEIARTAAAAGLPGGIPALDLPAVVDRLAALRRVSGSLASHTRQLDSFRAEVTELCVDLGIDPPAEDESHRRTFDEVSSSLASLKAREEERRHLEEAVLATSREIDRTLGAGDEAEVLRGELTSDRVLEWRRERESLLERVGELESAHEEAVREHERLTRRLAELSDSEEIARLEQRVHELDEGLRSDLGQFLVVATARLLLQRTLKRYEDERQPAVLERAASHFSRVTGGRYARLVVDSPDPSKPSLRVLAPGGQSLDAADLSRGAREQLYLCLRLALAETFADRYVPLPIVLDDVLVNFDPARQEAVVDELAETARRHQILFFTCHPHLAQLLQERTDSAATRVVEIDRPGG